MRLFHLAHIDTVTLNVFSWAMLQPDEKTYDFSKLDKIMGIVKKNGLKVCLATSTGAHPAWMARKYPDILRTEHNGMRRKFGRRHLSCPNSPTYRKFASALVEKLAKRYGNEESVIAWHVSNEYGGMCFCDNCEKKFRIWLKEKYKTIEELNRVWNTAFWSHTIYEWEDVVVPNLLSEEFINDGVRTTFQGISLDYARFNSDSMLACFEMEKEILKKYAKDIPVTTNFMGMFKRLDYQKWAKSLDFISWDNYPGDEDEAADVAMRHDLMRGLKQGKSFALMEQTPSVNNWNEVCRLKRPGIMRLYSYQAVAHGADTVLFFQMRRSIGACEKFHSAVIDHVGNEHTRIFREVAELGKELEYKMKDIVLGGRIQAKIAILFDWDNWWAVEYSAGPSRRIQYCDEIKQYYKALFSMQYPIDFISVEDDLTQYSIVIAPLLYMCKTGYDEKVREYVKQGGTFVTSYLSGFVEEHDLVVTGGYPGKLRDILGIWVEEIDALYQEESNSFVYQGQTYPAEIACELLHLEGAEGLAQYETDFYHGMPVLTRNSYGAGEAYHVATRSSQEFYRSFFIELCNRKKITPTAIVPEGIEAVIRKNERGDSLFLLNHTCEEQSIFIEYSGIELLTQIQYEVGDYLKLPPKEVAVLFHNVKENDILSSSENKS